VAQAIPEAAWTRACEPLLRAVAGGAPATALEADIAALGALCGEFLPRQADDINELSDEVDS
jgi:uncharacterized membrane protein